MNVVYADVILYDNIGMVYNGNSINISGMGGSEFQSILLLEEFAKLGKKVICLNNGNQQITVNGVLYLPHMMVNSYQFKCNNLIIHRYSDIPKIHHKKCFLWVTDLNGPHNLKFYNLLENHKLELICLSQFQANQFSNNWKKHVINFIIPDWIYNYEIPEQKSGYVYASSLMKGYNATFAYWKFLKKNNILNKEKFFVCLPGYDNPQTDISMAELDINYLNTLPLKQVVDTIAKCEGMFYVNVMPETFGISVVLAEILKATPYILGLNGLGALPELINSQTLTTDTKTFIDYFVNKDKNPLSPKTFKSERIIKEWENVMV